MNFSLNTTIIKPISGRHPANAVILLHGYGGDGKDISTLSYNWRRFLPDTIFICPDAPETCSINSIGYQWFDLSNLDEKFIIEKSKVAEKKIINFISEVKKFYNLKYENICLSGFSQGCMMSINVGLTVEEKFNCIVGFSGKIISRSDLSGRIKSKPNIFLLHGDKDEIVPTSHILESKEFFMKMDYKIKIMILKNCEHNIPVEGSSLALKFIKKNLYRI